MNAPFVRSAYNYDTNAASDETAIHCKDQTLTQQQFAEESDINFIAERYKLTGEMPQVLDLPKYGDFGGVFDFQTAQDAVVQAKQQFMTLPAKMRARFDNEPQRLLQFLEDPANKEEATFLGLLTKTEAAPGPEATVPPQKGTPQAEKSEAPATKQDTK